MNKVLFVDLENEQINSSLQNLKYYTDYRIVICVHKGNGGMFRRKLDFDVLQLPNVKLKIVDYEGKQIVDFYIYTKAIEMKMLNPTIKIAVLSTDKGFSTFAQVSKAIDKVYVDLPIPKMNLDTVLDKDIQQLSLFMY